jgi:hypothetical protein
MSSPPIAKLRNRLMFALGELQTCLSEIS